MGTARYSTVEKSKPLMDDEPLKFGVATPTAGTGTLKRAEMKLADTDSYKGRVVRMSDDGDQEKKSHVPYEVRKNFVLQGSYGHEKPKKSLNFRYLFSRPGM